MAGIEMNHGVVVALLAIVVLVGVYQYDPTFFGLSNMLSEGFESMTESNSKEKQKESDKMPPLGPAGMVTGPAGGPAGGMAGGMTGPSTAPTIQGFKNKQGLKNKEGYADLNAYEGKADFGSAEAPAGCYPRDQLTPSELLPKDMGSIWAEQNPMGPGSLKGKNFLSAGALIGVNTVGQSLRNANLQVRSEPPNPQVAVSIFNQSTISPDISHRPLEIGS